MESDRLMKLIGLSKTTRRTAFCGWERKWESLHTYMAYAKSIENSTGENGRGFEIAWQNVKSVILHGTSGKLTPISTNDDTDENTVKIIDNGLAKPTQESLPCPMSLEIISHNQWDVATLTNKENVEHLALIQVTVTLKSTHWLEPSNPDQVCDSTLRLRDLFNINHPILLAHLLLLLSWNLLPINQSLGRSSSRTYPQFDGNCRKLWLWPASGPALLRSPTGQYSDKIVWRTAFTLYMSAVLIF